MNSLEEWPTFTIEQMNQTVNDIMTNVLTNIITVLEKKRGYLDNPEDIRAMFNFYPVEPKSDDKPKSLLRRIK